MRCKRSCPLQFNELIYLPYYQLDLDKYTGEGTHLINRTNNWNKRLRLIICCLQGFKSPWITFEIIWIAIHYLLYYLLLKPTDVSINTKIKWKENSIVFLESPM